MTEQSLIPLTEIKNKLITASRILGGAMKNAGTDSPYWTGYEALQEALAALGEHNRADPTPDSEVKAGPPWHMFESGTYIWDAKKRTLTSTVTSVDATASITIGYTSEIPVVGGLENDLRDASHLFYHCYRMHMDTADNPAHWRAAKAEMLRIVRPYLRTTMPVLGSDDEMTEEQLFYWKAGYEACATSNKPVLVTAIADARELFPGDVRAVLEEAGVPHVE